MNSVPNTTLINRLKLRWYLLLRWILGLWVKPQLQPDANGA